MLPARRPAGVSLSIVNEHPRRKTIELAISLTAHVRMLDFTFAWLD